MSGLTRDKAAIPVDRTFRYGTGHALAIAGLDFAIFAISNLLVSSIADRHFQASVVGPRVDGPLAAAALVAAFALAGMYRRSFALAPMDEYYQVAAGICITLLPVAAFELVVLRIPLIVFIFSTLLGSVLIGTARAIIWRAVPKMQEAGGRRPFDSRQLSICSRGGRFIKRLLDVIVAAAALVVLSPLVILAAIAVWAESGLPIIYRQFRVGAGGRPFAILKFRSMRLASIGTGTREKWAKPGDDRITKVGAILRRTSIDEVPQLLNVLRGEMSVVGPRPEMTAYAEEFSGTLARYGDRHLVPPGITGWAQVTLPRVLEPEDEPTVLDRDLFYVENWSPLLDFFILAKTATELLFHRVAA